jgi:hypothetical protein
MPGMTNSASFEAIPPGEYANRVESLKARVRKVPTRAALGVDQGLVRLYRSIGREILERQSRQGGGTKVVERLTEALKAAFAELTGPSRTHLASMRSFAQDGTDVSIIQQLVGQLPWGTTQALLDKVAEIRANILAVEKEAEGLLDGPPVSVASA